MKKLYKGVLDMTKAGIVTGIGADVVTKSGGNAAGLGNIASSFSTIGTVMGASAALRSLPKTRRRRRHGR